MDMSPEYVDPPSLTDEELYAEYQKAKEHGPILRLDTLQLEIAQRWEAEMRDEMRDEEASE